MKQILVISISALLMVTLFANSQTRMSRSEYIDQYKALAIKEMHRSGIPASITMAQGCLESGNGNSKLSRRSNNHFGIKCRNDWKGARVYHHDDALNECFRKYRTVEESYIDHTDFLMQNGRYSFLFQLGHTNYKAWARGLKKAGYATDPKYANRLIKIIEDEKLYLLDEVEPGELAQYIPKIETDDKNALDNAREKVIETFDNLKINPYDNREVMIVNGLEAIRAMPGDTYESIAREMDMKRWEVIHYNDLPKDAVQPKKNELIYLERKRYNAPKGHEKHRVQAGQTMHDVAQKYGIKLNRLYRLNRMDKEQEARSGQVLYLRKKKPRE
ncbi:MAG: glucosaminidase domain-containing protein [Prolixibacteraceae bacterium]|nr:glucosaminidase domain-containing protein [Prolixibacteraceae bacterium]